MTVVQAVERAKQERSKVMTPKAHPGDALPPARLHLPKLYGTPKFMTNRKPSIQKSMSLWGHYSFKPTEASVVFETEESLA